MRWRTKGPKLNRPASALLDLMTEGEAMVDMSAIASALASLKAAKDIAEAMVGLRDAAAFQGKLIEFQSKIIDANNAAFTAQEERSALLERIRELEAQVAKFKAWEAEKEKYELTEVRPGAFAYSLKEEAAIAGPMHQLCASCFERGHRSILQKETRQPGMSTVLACHECGSDIYVSGPQRAEHAALRRGPRR